MTQHALPIRHTPIHAWAQAHNAQFAGVAGWRCAERYAALGAEMALARQGVALADVTPNGKLQVEGGEAPRVIQAAFGGVPGAAGDGWHGEAEHVYCVRPDLFYVLTWPGGEGHARDRLNQAHAAQAAFVTITDLTHGLAALCLVGPASRSVLRKVSALNFEPAAFPNLAVRVTSLARTKQIILRRDLGSLPAFIVAGAPSLAGYVWEVLLEAGREFELAPIGWAALEALDPAIRGHA